MKKLIPLMLVFLSAFQIHSQKLIQDVSKTTVVFKIKYFGSYVDALFTKVDIDGNFDQKDLESSFLNATIDVNSFDTNNSYRDEILSKDYFDVKNHPTITLKSTEIEKVAINLYNLKADLNIKGITKSVTLPLIVSENGNKISIKSGFTIDRLDYKVGKSSFLLSRKVITNVNFLAVK
ncbi:YceI family protein [uncultured Tenacibaculum sp.]|uniref:YceI family protein n=1 Tax=uncultured Tenacibaculum sp. TaxID=174713 RepID=UPI00261496CF|nr:YceI family protein [uncultured Tenacibaculum sp.]